MSLKKYAEKIHGLFLKIYLKIHDGPWQNIIFGYLKQIFFKGALFILENSSIIYIKYHKNICSIPKIQMYCKKK